MATRPNCTSPALRHRRSPCSNSPASAAPCRLRKSLSVRKSGWFPAARKRQATLSSSCRAIFRDEYTPVQYPYSSTLTIIRG
jgi:hypothetical protein